jgi:hypothetical protein
VPKAVSVSLCDLSNPVVVTVCHVKVSIGVDGNAIGVVESRILILAVSEAAGPRTRKGGYLTARGDLSDGVVVLVREYILALPRRDRSRGGV